MKILYIILIYALFAFVHGRVHAEEMTAKEAEALVARLGAKQFKVRKQASAELEALLKANPDLSDLFEPYLNHSDPEVSSRIEEALAKLMLHGRWVDVLQEGKVTSPKDHNPRRVRFVNLSQKAVKIFWLDYEGKRVPWSGAGSVRQGDDRVCGASYEGHAWLFTDEDERAMGIFILGKKTTEVVFTGPPE
jgi:hypothetical protein